jgi:lauroyl/myristoyl acyltransferase
MSLQGLFSHPATLRLAAVFSRYVPARSGHHLARLAAAAVCRLQPEVYRIVRANLGQVLGPAASAGEVHDRTWQVFYHFVLGYFDFFRSLRLPREQVLQLIEVPGALRTMLRSEAEAGRGLLLVIPHTGNFDLAGRVMTFYAPSIQVISLPDPHPGFRSLNALRQQAGAQITPLSPAALRQALRTLRGGGVVGLGGDRPVSELDDPVPFFGRPAHMPSGHVRLALKTDALVVVVGCVYRSQDQRYAVVMEPPLEMVRTGDAAEEARINTCRVLEAMEKIIQRWSEQWMMFVPVWPELLEG